MIEDIVLGVRKLAGHALLGGVMDSSSTTRSSGNSQLLQRQLLCSDHQQMKRLS